jgi:hypothetical protein
MSRAGSLAAVLVVAGRFGTLWRGGAERGLSDDVAVRVAAARVPRLSGVGETVSDWNVTLRCIGYATVRVEAESEEDAIEQAHNTDPWELDVEISDTEADAVWREEEDDGA